MDVGREDFDEKLPQILKHIADATFVSFDLELSGIPLRERNREGRQSLAERYEQVRQAAKDFHILQVGLTCVEEDPENEKYLFRCYNFNISPLVFEGLDLERRFTYSSGAVEYLLSHGYRMDSPFKRGVPYMNRHEADSVSKRRKEQIDRNHIPDLKIRPNDHQAIAFLEQVTKEIDEWQRSGKPFRDHYNVGIAHDVQDPTVKEPLNAFQRRLVHQLVRSKYPGFSTQSINGLVQIQPKDRAKLQEQDTELQQRIAHAVSRQSGFRWIAEAMAGSSMSDFEPTASGPSRDIDPKGHRWAQKMFDEVLPILRQKHKVVVGHNLFMDLAFFYQFFFEDLPETVGEFSTALSKVFPLIIDTKYLATSGLEGYKNRSLDLSQIEAQLSEITKPEFETVLSHSYSGEARFHEAGYDSFVTAKVFLKLAVKLEREGQYTEEAAHSLTSSSKKDDNAEVQPRPTRKAQNGMFSHKNPFDSLDAIPVPNVSGVDAEAPSSSSNAVPPSSKTRDLTREQGSGQQHDPDGSDRDMIPSWHTDFWRVYGNKLRVYGTIEEVHDLTRLAGETSKDETSSEAQGLRRRSSTLWEKIRSLII